MTHASMELMEAMAGLSPVEFRRGSRRSVGSCGAPACGAEMGTAVVCAWAMTLNNNEPKDQSFPDCRDCRDLFPDAIKVRHDYLEERDGVRP